VDALYPLHLRLTHRLVVVVGAGPVGRRRVASLSETSARLRWVAPDVPTTAEVAEPVRAPFSPDHLDGAHLVFACATPEANAEVVRAARARGLLVGRADSPDEGDFNVPARLRRGALLVSLGTGGSAPAATRAIRDALSTRLPASWAVVVDEVAAARPDADAAALNALARRLLDKVDGSLD